MSGKFVCILTFRSVLNILSFLRILFQGLCLHSFVTPVFGLFWAFPIGFSAGLFAIIGSGDFYPFGLTNRPNIRLIS